MKRTNFTRLHHPVGSARRQRGVSLFLALIALVAMTLAAIGLTRSHQASALIAGNIAFKQSTVQNADTAIEAAMTALGTITTTSLDANIANQYFANQQPTDSMGVPTTINWNTVPCRDSSGSTVSCSDASLYRMQYVIDRLCDPAVGLPVTDVEKNCVMDAPVGGGSKKSGAVVFTKGAMVYYRVTARVQGPRNATSIVQAILGYRN